MATDPALRADVLWARDERTQALKGYLDRLREAIEIADGHLDRALEGLEDAPWVEAAQVILRRATGPDARDEGEG